MSVAKFDKTVLVTVSTIKERDMMIRRMYTNLTKEPIRDLTVAKDQVNRIQVYHNLGAGRRVLVRTYLVIVVPIIVDLAPLDAVLGRVDFHLDNTIERLRKLISKLESLKGERIVKGTPNGKIFEQLVRSLSAVNGEY